MKYLSQNSKLKKDNIWSFDLEPIKTCPGAGKCKQYCYGKKGCYRIFEKNIKKHWDNNKALTKSKDFVSTIVQEIKSKRKKPTAIRIHATGDFYNQEYLNKWLTVAGYCPDIQFYCYTKSFNLDWPCLSVLPNFKMIQSEGSIHDNLIDYNKPVARIFKDAVNLELTNLNQSNKQHWIDCSESDLLAVKSTYIGLIAH